jgi:hypothetical protein
MEKMRGWMKCQESAVAREASMRGDFVKIKKGVAVTNQYAAAIRDDKERKGKKVESMKSMTRLLSPSPGVNSLSCLAGKETSCRWRKGKGR